MAISVRKRGEVWHARGTIRVGKDTLTLPEFSTGEGTRAAALEAGEREAKRIREEHLDGATGRARRLTVGDCILAYLQRPGGLQPYDENRAEQLNELMGHLPIAETAAGWQSWLRLHPAASPGTVQRWRTILAAALRMGCDAHQVTPPKLPAVKQSSEERLVFLAPGERRSLLRAYNPHAACPVLLLAYQGLRTQEALRLDWRAVNLDRSTVYVAPSGDRASSGTKSGRGRTVPMHQRVSLLLTGMHAAAGKPDIGPVFLSIRGEPYADTRGQGGNPLRQAHDHACATAKITGFRVHDWRHDWAARCVMSGMDLPTLMRLGGWSTLRMVEKYASVTAEHMADALRRIA